MPNIGFYFGLKDMQLLTREEIERLTPAERLLLISQLWDSLRSDPLPVTTKQQAELVCRLITLGCGTV